MKKKSMLLIMVSALIVSLLSATAMAATGLSEQEARRTAEQHIPEGSVFHSAGLDSRKYELKYYNEKKQERYEVDVLISTKKVTSFESELFADEGSTEVALSEDEIKKLVVSDLPNAEVVSVTLDKSDILREYDVVIKAADYYGELTLNPKTGKILSRDIRIGKSPVAAEAGGLLTRAAALELAKKQVPGGVVTDLDLDRRGTSYVFEAEVYLDGVEHDLVFDAADGKLLYSTKSTDDWNDADWLPRTPEAAKSGEYIGMEKARQIALAKVPGATVVKCELDYDDGRATYEGEVYKDRMEYEFEIDALTGKVLKWEQDYDD